MTAALAHAHMQAAAAPPAQSRGERRSAGAVRPWSALVCGVEGDRTLLVVDWLLLACRAAGMVAQAIPLAGGDAMPLGMYVEVAGDDVAEQSLGDVPWGAVDLVVAGEHLELMRALEAGFIDPEVTSVVASCRRSYTNVERVVAPQHVLSEREIDAAVQAASRAYHAFDGPEVAGWYHLPASAQAGLLLGAAQGSGVLGVEAEHVRAAIEELGIDVAMFTEALRRGERLGRRTGGRIRRTRTAYQFTRRRRKLVAHPDRAQFEQLIARAHEVVGPDEVAALQDAIFLACQFQDASWAGVLLQHVEEIVDAERAAIAGAADARESVIPDAIRSLAALMVWPDPAWVANRKRRRDRLKELRAAYGLSRRHSYELIDHIPISVGALSPHSPVLLQPVRVEHVRTTSLTGALRLRRLAAGARQRSGSALQRHELDTLETWLTALHDALRSNHELARIVARSGTMLQGYGAVRESHRAAAHAFWGRIVRPSLAMDRARSAARVDDPRESIASIVIPFAWEQLCRSGPLALWEHAGQVLGIALAYARGLSHEDAVTMARASCSTRRPLDGC